MRVRVKVCGITTVEDALMAAELGADAIGLNFASGSPRQVAPRRARSICQALPPLVDRVGVVVNPSPEELAGLAAEVELNWIQFHGEETPEECAASPLPWFKAFRTGPGFDLEALASYASDLHLLDGFCAGLRGGTGEAADWSLAARAARRYRIILAGGLRAENIVEAVEAVGALAVDVNSGVESAPGKKDPQALGRLFACLAARGYR